MCHENLMLEKMKTWPQTRKTAVILTKDVALKADQHNNNHFPAFYGGEMTVSNTSPPKNYSFNHVVDHNDNQVNTEF
jgi:hypothetical protein